MVKNLSDFNSVDCGIFLCSYSLFEALEKAVSDNKTLLSDAVEILIKDNQIILFDIKGKFWIDIDTEDDLANAERKLLQSLQKPQDGVISKFINRKISIQLSRFL